MSQNAGETGQARDNKYSHLYLPAPCAHPSRRCQGFDLQQHFFRSRRGDIIFANFDPGVAPDQAAQISLASFDVFCTKFENRFWIPIRDQGNTLHFAFHIFLEFLTLEPNSCLDLKLLFPAQSSECHKRTSNLG